MAAAPASMAASRRRRRWAGIHWRRHPIRGAGCALMSRHGSWRYPGGAAATGRSPVRQPADDVADQAAQPVDVLPRRSSKTSACVTLDPDPSSTPASRSVTRATGGKAHTRARGPAQPREGPSCSPATSRRPAYHCDSARVENRGPSMTTIVAAVGDRPLAGCRGRYRACAKDRAEGVGKARVVGDRGRRRRWRPARSCGRPAGQE